MDQIILVILAFFGNTSERTIGAGAVAEILD